MIWIKELENGAYGFSMNRPHNPAEWDCVANDHENALKALEPAIYCFVTVMEMVRSERCKKVKETIWVWERNKTQEELGITPALTAEELAVWLQYWEDLRNFPDTITELPEGGYDGVVWPTEPTVV